MLFGNLLQILLVVGQGQRQGLRSRSAAVGKPFVNTNAPSKHARTLEVKKAVIEAAEQNNNKSELAKQFNMPRSTIRDILVNKEAILRAIDRGGDVTRARLTPGKHNHLEEELLSWIKNVQSQNISITGTLIKEKAKELGALLKIEGFQASNGWLENFKKRNSVTLRSNQGEVTDINTELLNDWPQQVLHDAFAEYSLDESQDPEDINDISNDANSLSSQTSKQPNFTVEILAGDSLNDQILNKQKQALNTSQNGSVNGEEANRTIEMNTNTPNNTNDPTAAIKNLMNQQNLKQSYYSLALKAEKDLREARQKAEEEKTRREEELFNLQIEKERAQIRLYDSQRELAEAQTYLIKLKTKMLEVNMNQDLKSQDQTLPNHEDDTLE
uniref:HTH CENPB-type domain-containing protein n=1 Tax=Acrobeloides nanus TaxID=290746 RepID=A0A914D8E1_9BILA